MRDVTGLQDTNTSDKEVHKDRSAARMARDAKDLQTILHYFSERKPFSKDLRELRSLSSGVLADKSVDVDTAESFGQAILQSLYGKSVAEYTFRKKDQSPHLPHPPTSLLRENVWRSTPNSYSSALLWLVKRLLTHKFYLHMSCHLIPHHCLIAVF